MAKRPMGIGKRVPSYVPKGGARDCLMSMSKADLAELVWDYAIRAVGEDAGLGATIAEVLATANLLAAWTGRKNRAAIAQARGEKS